ncbi:MAG: hypothetical protein ACTSYI_00635 [Promethearchaeota archaeon]
MMGMMDYGNHMDWDMMHWDMDSMGYFPMMGMIAIFALMIGLMALSRRRHLHAKSTEATPKILTRLETPTQARHYEERIIEKISYCTHCGFRLHNSEIRFCPECGTSTS